MGQNISIGSNCICKLQFNSHNFKEKNNPTLFFDYLITGNIDLSLFGTKETTIQDSYTEKLSLKNVNNILIRTEKFTKNEFKIAYDYLYELKKNKYDNIIHSVLVHKDFISIHDLNLDKSNLDECVDKFNRRLERLKNVIKKNDLINFIRIEYNDYNLNDYKEFISIIKKINPICKINIKLVSYANINKKHNILNFKIYCIKDNILKNIKPTFELDHINWKKIFTDTI